MKVTPSLRNLNQDPLMADALVYYLQAGGTLITTPDDASAAAGSIVLGGGGMVANHGTVRFTKGGRPSIEYVKGSGAAFLNGELIKAECTPLKHNDRLILGNTQAFRVVDPLDPEASKPQKALIDWDLAQNELAAAMGTAVDLKVDEEVAKKKAELDAQLRAMEEKFARENEALKAQLAGKAASAAQAATLKQMDKRAAAIDEYKHRVRIHLAEYKRELIRMEDALRKLLPLISEANALAGQLGRGVTFSPALVTVIPQSMTLSPVEELLTQKVTDLLVKIELSNPRTNAKRDWMWPPELFFDRVGHMRNAWQEWMLKEIPLLQHSPSDPFWSPPRSQHVGDAYLYLAPVAYGVAFDEWIPILNYQAQMCGELHVVLKPKTKPTIDPFSLIGQSAAFELLIDGARGMIDCPNKSVRVEYVWGSEDFSRKTPTGTGKKFEPSFGFSDELSLPAPISDKEVAYLCKDALKMSVYGESEDVEEAEDTAAVLEVPPEVFDAFLAYDVRAALAAEQYAFDDGTKAHVVPRETPLSIAVIIGQENKNFKICDVGRVYLGNLWEAGTSAALDTAWTALPISRQSRAGEIDRGYLDRPWLVECSLPALPAACATGKVYELDLKCNVQELEKLGPLEEPLEIKKTITLKVVDKGDAATTAIDAAENKRRQAVLTSQQEVYLGTFEVTDDAVNNMMQLIRDSASGDAKDAKAILQEQSSELEQLKGSLMAEVTRQYESLGLRAAAAGLELKDALSLWQLPSELLGSSGPTPEDAEGLKKLVGELRAQLGSSTSELEKARQRIAQLEAELAAAKKLPAPTPQKAKSYKGGDGGGAAEQPKSSACVIL